MNTDLAVASDVLSRSIEDTGAGGSTSAETASIDAALSNMGFQLRYYAWFADDSATGKPACALGVKAMRKGG